MKIDKLIPDSETIESTVTENVVDKSVSLNETEETFKVNLTPSKRKKVRKVKVEIEGDLSIVNIYKVKKEIVSVFENFDIVDINLDKIINMDMSCVQLLLAVKMYYSSLDKEITLKINLPEELKNVITNSGFKSLINN
ncbi:MAG: hypothetical protein RQ875_04875 [Vicingaceae bacterium]|nr:hypothetical protein [Vicingaceae bacterium]